MDRRLLIGSLALVLVAGIAVAVAVGPLESPVLDDGDIATETPTPTGGASGESEGTDGGGGGDAGAAETPTPRPPLELTVDSVEPCGETCRDVTATIENNQDRRATGVTVDTTIYAGDGTDGDVVWEGSRDVGTLESGASQTDTTRIELGWLEAAAVQSAGGEITIETLVETDRRSLRFVERRDVS